MCSYTRQWGFITSAYIINKMFTQRFALRVILKMQFLPRPLMAVDSPFLNDALQLHVRNVETSLKCEIWMLSSVKNYLEDQLLGFALVPLSEGLTSNGKLEREFSLSLTDLLHSPAGFVKLSLSFSGPFPEVFVITAPAASVGMDTLMPNAEPNALVPTEFDKIELSD
ncbi:hypothetical protein Leryth_027442 [Lithospermum erythrorhizon]|nr:hypothetical protein Leryth_027442 [Lithospermum erythrorhizon]